MKQLTRQEIQSVNGASATAIGVAALTGTTLTIVGWAGTILQEGITLYPLFEWKNYALMGGTGAIAGLTAYTLGNFYN